MSFHKFTDKHKKWDAVWLALGETTCKSVYKKQYKVKILRRLDQEAMDSKQEQHRQLYLHKLNGICSDMATFKDVTVSRWDHLRKALDATNVYFFRKLSNYYYEFQRTHDFRNYRHSRTLREAVIKSYPLLEQFRRSYYDVVQVFNREGTLLYFLAQNTGPVTIPHKAAAKLPFGNEEFCPDQSLYSNVLNYFVLSLFSEVVIKLTCNDFIAGCIAPVYCGKFRVGRIHLNPFGELLLKCETVRPGKLNHDYIVKSKLTNKAHKYVFLVHEVTKMDVIATIKCKVWKCLDAEVINRTRMIGLCFKESVTIIDKTLIFGAALIIVHEFYRTLWKGDLREPNKIIMKNCKVMVKRTHDVDSLSYSVPQMPALESLQNNKFTYKEKMGEQNISNYTKA